jgi:hypothetical protein
VALKRNLYTRLYRNEALPSRVQCMYGIYKSVSAISSGRVGGQAEPPGAARMLRKSGNARKSPSGAIPRLAIWRAARAKIGGPSRLCGPGRPCAAGLSPRARPVGAGPASDSRTYQQVSGTVGHRSHAEPPHRRIAHSRPTYGNSARGSIPPSRSVISSTFKSARHHK